MALKSWILVAIALVCMSMATAQQQEQPAELTCANRETFDWNNYLQSRLQTRLQDDETDAECSCVKYFECSSTPIDHGAGGHKPNEGDFHGGENIIDIRVTGNCHYLEVCCPPNRVIVESETGGGDIGGGTGGGTGGGIGGGTGGGIGGTGGGIGSGTEGGIGGTGGGLGGDTDDRGPEETGNKFGCGHRNPDGIGFCIIGEQNGEAEYGEFPWMVAIAAKKNNMFMYQCGGSLINHGVVLTSAHCVANLVPGELVVRAGEWDTQTENEQYEYQDRNVKSFVIHEKYYAAALYNDVALLFLTEPVTDAPNIGVVCLPEQGAVFAKNERCFVSGWGKDVYGKNGTHQVFLKKRDLPVVSKTDCQKALRKTRLGAKFKLDDSFMCAGGEAGHDACTGDGGSPLVCPIRSATGEEYYQQAGIVAWGIGCGEHQTPGVYVDVARFRHWIDQKMANNFVDVTSYIKH